MQQNFFPLEKNINTINCCSVAFSNDSKLMAAGNISDVILYDVDTFNIKHTLKGHGGNINDLRFSNCNKMLLSGSDDSKVILWDIE